MVCMFCCRAYGLVGFGDVDDYWFVYLLVGVVWCLIDWLV